MYTQKKLTEEKSQTESYASELKIILQLCTFSGLSRSHLQPERADTYSKQWNLTTKDLNFHAL